jgi:hypothetical protein
MAVTQEAPALRPMTVSDLFDETVKLYRRNFGQLIALAAFLMTPFLVLFLGAGVAGLGSVVARPGQTPSTAVIVAFLGAFGLAFLVGLVIYPIGMAALIHAVSEARFGRRLGVGEALRRGTHRYWALTALMFVHFSALALMWITVLGIPFTIYFSVAWAFGYMALLLEGTGVFGSLSRSRALVRGMWWRTFGIAMLFLLFQWVVSFIITFPVSFVVGFLGVLLSGPGVAQPAVAVLNALSQMLGSVLPLPILYIGWVLYYYDLRVRKEGLDLELRAQQLQATTPPPPLFREPEPGG